ncbi:MAG TPA: PilZ domain-containing protein [Bacteriovoracaceae bacterium]|nr:PilZ domain-containing protein [Bacteriovoracaceae bacterium]
MMKKSYQRRHLRAPLREGLLYADGSYVLKASTLNISEGGILVNHLPSFPEGPRISLMVSIPHMPALKNFNLLKMQTFSKDLFSRRVVRATVELIRREELSQNLDNIFRSRFGLKFLDIDPQDLKVVEDYVQTFSSNLIFLQTLIDSYNTDEDTKVRTRALAGILGYAENEKISQLHSAVTKDYKSLQWL